MNFGKCLLVVNTRSNFEHQKSTFKTEKTGQPWEMDSCELLWAEIALIWLYPDMCPQFSQRSVLMSTGTKFRILALVRGSAHNEAGGTRARSLGHRHLYPGTLLEACSCF